MRIIYPEDVNIALDICASYITYSKKRWKNGLQRKYAAENQRALQRNS